MYALLAAVCLTFTVVACNAEKSFDQSLDHTWGLYKKTYTKKYALDEEHFRRTIWEENVRLIRRHNLEHDLGLHSYTLGINEYADLSREEYKRFLLGYRTGNVSADWQAKPYKPSGGKLPSEVDWRRHGYVTHVKNQGQCGSCWAFSSTGSLEGQHYKVSGTLYSLSEQNLVDCVTGNAGCNGGWMDTAFEYVRLNKGIDIEYGYPYQAKDGPCRFKKSYVAATDKGAYDIQAGNETALQSAVANEGPISVAIDATHQSFMLYKSGLYDEPKCTHSLDHAVLVVGYGTTQEGSDYWLVKNSWGTSWGMEGYIMMSRNKDNQCGIADKASFPKV